MATVSVNMRIDAELKKQAEELFHELGFTLTGAVTSFLRQSVHDQGLPYRPSIKYSKALVDSCREAERIAHDPAIKGYTDVNQMFDEILNEDVPEVNHEQVYRQADQAI